MTDRTNSTNHYDVAIVGGGPAGSTVAALLKKYNPDLSVLVLEKETFPREHVGESQLPACCHVLDEMGCWEKVEAANFPVKIGASLTWGRTDEPWDFDFYPPEHFVDEPRPGKFVGQRRRTAFQVDRAIYDEILLRHAESLGAEVRQDALVRTVHYDQSTDEVRGIELDSGETITARYYVDASGNVALFARALGVTLWEPEELRNIALWDYWENAEWAVKIGVGATRVLVRSLPYGWIWFIPLGPTRTSIGLICPASYYRQQKKPPAELYHEALQSEKQISRLIRNATAEGTVRTTKDWSRCAERVAGGNWFLCGEAAGFADPILAAGMALTHTTAREVAYTILELERESHDPQWLRNRYNERARKTISQHIRFAQYWYSANGRFSDLQEHCQKIAREAGLKLSPQQAWRWLAQGGFVNFSTEYLQIGSFDVFSARLLIEKFAGRDSTFAIEHFNDLRLNLHGAEKKMVGELHEGRIRLVESYVKGDKILPLEPPFEGIVYELGQSSDMTEVTGRLKAAIDAQAPPQLRARYFYQHLGAIESMIEEGWIIAKKNRKRPFLAISRETIVQLRDTAEGLEALERARRSRQQDRAVPAASGTPKM